MGKWGRFSFFLSNWHFHKTIFYYLEAFCPTIGELKEHRPSETVLNLSRNFERK